MPPRKKSHKSKGQNENQASSEREKETATGAEAGSGDGAGSGNRNETEEGARQATRAQGLRQFMQSMQGKHHRAVEMRLVLICGTIITAQVLFSEKLTDPALSKSAFLYMLTCIIMTVFSTWLDYFPSRLSDIQPREAESQGIPLACLLLPMVCSGIVHSALYNATHLLGLLSFYLAILCALSLCSVLASLFHAIPHPNHVVFYNFAAFGLALAMQHWMEVPFWPLLVSIAIYSLLTPWLLYTFPESFTLGEAVIVAQGGTLLLVDTGMQLLRVYDLVQLPSQLAILRSPPIVYLEVLTCGVFLCCFLFLPVLYKVSVATQHYDLKFWSGTFILLSLSVGVLLVLPWIPNMLQWKEGAILHVLFFPFNNPVRIMLLVYWLMVLVATVVLVWAQTSNTDWLVPLKSDKPSSLWMRKCFHLLALLVYYPGLALDPDMLALGASLFVFLFIVAELVRLFRMWPFGEQLHQLLEPMLDERDSGPLLLTHIYLLFGFSLPVWLFPLRNYDQVAKLSMYSGVLSLGIGDSVAAVAGNLMGKTKWPGTSKTVEGTLMSVMTQMLGVLFIVINDPHISFLSSWQWGVTAVSLVLTGLLEAYTWQIDNLILSLFQFSLLITFL